MRSKKEIREVLKGLLQDQKQLLRDEKSRLIADKLFRHPVFQKARVVFFYMSMPEEVQTGFMIDRALAAGKKVAVPVADLKTRRIRFFEIRDRKDLKAGIYGILEPDPSASLEMDPGSAECVIVPGLAFDPQKNRLGHGAGFYDRFLPRLDPKTFKVALAFSFQLLDQVPVEAHDVVLDEIITEL